MTIKVALATTPFLNENNIITHVYISNTLKISHNAHLHHTSKMPPLVSSVSSSRASAQPLFRNFFFIFFVVCCCFSTFEINIPLFYIFIMSSLCRVMILFCCRQNILRACAESKRKCTFLYRNVHVECCASESSSSSSSSGQPL